MGDHRASTRGSVLVLMPATVLIVVLLGAIAVDRAVVFGAQRELVHAAQAAANDAAATGVDVAHLRRGPGAAPVRLDRSRVESAVRSSLVGVEDLVAHRWTVRGDVVEVTLVQRVHLVLGPGVPGAEDSTTVTATATASIEVDP